MGTVCLYSKINCEAFLLCECLKYQLAQSLCQGTKIHILLDLAGVHMLL